MDILFRAGCDPRGFAQPVASDTNDRNVDRWFSDKTCARVTDDTPRPNGTACVKKCLAEGAALVFISEQAKAVFEVRDFPTAKDDVGYHVELTGTVNPVAKTISVRSVKRLSELTAICFIPKKGEKKKENVVAHLESGDDE